MSFFETKLNGCYVPEFVESSTTIPGVKTEYWINEKGVQFHFWENPTFPENFGDIINSAFSKYPKDSVLSEYVPEVNSWYAHLVNLPVGLSPVLVESLINIISVAIINNDK